MSENVQEISPTCAYPGVLQHDTPSVLCSGNVSDIPNFLCTGSEMCMKFHLCIPIYDRKCEGNMLEMSCVLAQEMCLKFDPILYQEMLRKCQNFLV